MAATVEIHRLTGTAPTSTDITSACTFAGASDDVTGGCYIPVPSSGSNYSYWVNTQLECTVAPDNQINNVKWYTDGTNSFGTGIGCTMTTACTFIAASGTAGSSGIILSLANYPNIATGAGSDAFAYSSGCKLPVTGDIGATTGSFGLRVLFQLGIDSTASAGNSVEETFTFEYDEA